MIDIGVPGLILWLLFWCIAVHTSYSLRKAHSADDQRDNFSLLLLVLTFGFIGLLIEGMFLHVFEDSMVNYWFFALRGVVLGKQMSVKR